MPKLISKPGCADAKGTDETHHFAYYETKGMRPSQEDALAWQTFDAGELDALTPEQIGQRLWTTYHLINEQCRTLSSAGSTASTTVIKDNHLITATLADAAAFAVIYDSTGAIISIQRLNKRTHKPNLPEEKKRVEAAGGSVWGAHLIDLTRGMLAVSRAFGDFIYRGICADADIDITIIPTDAHHVQIITSCDGFTDGAGNHRQTKEGHEAYLKEALRAMNDGKPGLLSEVTIAENLAKDALARGSTDNVSVAVQTIKLGGTPASIKAMVGVYDGHGGSQVSHFVADHIGDELTKQLRLTPEAYAAQPLSVMNKAADYARDNPVTLYGTAIGRAVEDTSRALASADDARTSSPPTIVIGEEPSHLSVINPLRSTKPDMSPLEQIEASHGLLLRQIQQFIKHEAPTAPPTLKKSSSRHTATPQENLHSAAKQFKKGFSDALCALKEKRINLETYRANCKQAITTCEQSFRRFRSESIYERYFGPWVRSFLACLGENYRREYVLDTQVTSALHHLSTFKQTMNPTADDKGKKAPPLPFKP